MAFRWRSNRRVGALSEYPQRGPEKTISPGSASWSSAPHLMHVPPARLPSRWYPSRNGHSIVKMMPAVAAFAMLDLRVESVSTATVADFGRQGIAGLEQVFGRAAGSVRCDRNQLWLGHCSAHAAFTLAAYSANSCSIGRAARSRPPPMPRRVSPQLLLALHTTTRPSGPTSIKPQLDQLPRRYRAGAVIGLGPPIDAIKHLLRKARGQWPLNAGVRSRESVRIGEA
jgi:hypothetical protein